VTDPHVSTTSVRVQVSRRDGREPAANTFNRLTTTAMPLDGPLTDSYGRIHSDMRVSLTDRCNLRCVYCMPEEGMEFMARSESLTMDEIVRVAGIAHKLGITSIRLTGGEPLVRRGVVDLVRQLAAIGFSDIALTTNGMLLAPLAAPLKLAGLTRVNISCDSLRTDRFASVRRRGDLATVLAAMDAVDLAGLAPLKINVVLLRGVNDDEMLDFAAFARDTGRIVRFIEFMPLDFQGEWDRGQLIPGREILETISCKWPLEAVVDPSREAPAERFRFADGRGEIGVISSVTEPFCGTCNRLRLTADGQIRNCLFSDDEKSVRDVMRAGGDDSEIERVIRRSVWAKLPGHSINDPDFLRPRRSMSMIGG
jgi:cyclic pyranopterin phosphate synthase